MMQLSLIGPPEEPATAPSRYRLWSKVHAAVLGRLSAHAIREEIAADVTDAVVDGLASRPPALDARTAILRMCDFRPMCWICGFAIDLAEPEDAPGSFSLDHVVPRSAGGTRLGIGNLKPAHRICNILRSSKRARRTTKQRYEVFLAALSERALSTQTTA